jgi:RNA polymerase sigma-70 factor (ECF subfamily)
MSRLSGSEEFGRLYNAHSRKLIAFFVHRTLDAQLALDLTAETFAQAYECRRRFRGTTPEEESGWLFGIARRQLGTYWRRGRAEQSAVRRLGLAVPSLSEDAAERVIELAGSHALRAAVAEELAHLPEATQQALRLRVVEERDYRDVARTLGTTEVNARARVSRGLSALASSLDLIDVAEDAR